MDNYIKEEDDLINLLNTPKTYAYNYLDNNIYNNNEELYEVENNIENYKLRKKIEELNMILNEKNKEIEEYRNKYDNQLIQINKNFDNHINEYQQKLNQVQNEIEYKNHIINELKHNMGINLDYSIGNNFSNKKIIQFLQILKDNIKNMIQNFFSIEDINFMENNEGNKNTNDIEFQFKLINRLINIFSENLSEYKNNNIFQKFYLSFIDIMNNFISNISFNFFQFNDFPKFSLNDKDEKKYDDILLIFNKITNFILKNQNNKKEDNNINEELDKN